MLVLCFLMLFILLLFPETAALGSKNGLMLWGTVLVPSLLPFSILSSLLRRQMQGGRWHYLLLAAGILSGYPIGAKIAGELYRDGSLSRQKALFFAGFTNNPSPMFVIFFVGENLLHLGSAKYLFYLLVLLSSFLGSVCFCLLTAKFSRKRNSRTLPPLPASSSEPAPFSRIIDEEISSSALLMIKIGGYIMLFSIFTAFMQRIPFVPEPLRLLACGVLEITTGTAMLAQAPLSSSIKIILSLAATAFGGLSAAAQTNSVLQNTGLSLSHYIMIKLFGSFFALLLGFLLFSRTQ